VPQRLRASSDIFPNHELLRERGVVGECSVSARNFATQGKLKESFGIGAFQGNERRCPLRQAIKARTIVRAFAFVG
jgi:hypothetical protein